MTLALGLLVAGLLAPLVAGRLGRRPAVALAAVLVVGAALHDASPLVDLTSLRATASRLAVLAPDGAGGRGLVLAVAALVWCGPAADLLVRSALDATRVPTPPRGATDERAGRWIGRLERWLLVVCIGVGQPALAVLPIGGKALFRYAEVVADARSERPRLQRANGDDPPVGRDTLVDYVIVGSLASWAQAIALGLLVAAA